MTAQDERKVYEAWLRLRIEALSDRYPAISEHALTSRWTEHVVFKNGTRKTEADDSASPTDPWEMVEMTLEAVKAYHKTVPPPQLLVWRALPAFDSEGGLYTRLCFETDLVRVGEKS